ncbi:putative membrane protein YfcA [Pedobacter sp. CAN_A7]|uniref:sulfite exporter TauE/SafE family protein n=1 Tax=Pedobacter sp. CAN_A7 TaxID=2787722 RepID=UPI0018C97571
MEIIAYLASVLIGLSLGLIGGGGSILTVPVMVYLFGITPLLATSYSLFIVGSTSLLGGYQHWKKGLVNGKAVLYFGLSSIVTVFMVRKYLLPLIPSHLFSIAGFTVTTNLVTMLLFAILMVAAALSMIRENLSNPVNPSATSGRAVKLLLYGVGIGLATALLGAGGGFLLIPVLVMLLGLTMKEAVGTSLMIIALNSLIGFAGDLGHHQIDWFFLLKITAIAILGLLLGLYVSRNIDGGKLKKAFGWFVLLMGVFIIITELMPIF